MLKCLRNMQGFRSKIDGLVNAADISRTRVENPKDVVKRDQQVWVKVISMAGGRLRLSMRDVDQKSGKDLVPMTKPGEGMLITCSYLHSSKCNNINLYHIDISHTLQFSF